MERLEKTMELLQKEADQFDDQESMVTRFKEADRVHGYHTALTGTVHDIKATSCFALCALLTDEKPLHEKAIRALYRVCELQDVRPESPTFGLWAYYMEQNVDQMTSPDYNWANFVGRDLIAVCLLCGDKLTDDLLAKLHTAIRNAAACTVKRNVAPDYTNISLIGSLTLISAGELMEDETLFQTGRQRLSELTEYTKVTTGLSEYNSAPYTVVALEETTRMLQFFRDPECLAMARYLNHCAWEMLVTHYNTSLAQLSPPQARAYADLDNGRLASVIWLGTNERYGKLREDTVDLDSLFYLQFQCPEDLLPLFDEKERFASHTYYHQNNIRQPGEDVTIIRELDSPDLTAFSYKTPYFSMGAFSICDTWNQRRNAMVIWDKDKPKTFRLRGLHNGYDFCSGFVRADQRDGKILGNLGLVTDRGSNHYILDKDKTGIYRVKELCFCFELGGNCDDVRIRQEGNSFYIDDGDMHIALHIAKWVFDGRNAEVALSPDAKKVILKGYEGEEILLDTTKLGDTYGVFTLNVSWGTEDAHKEAVSISNRGGGWLESEWCGLRVCSCRGPVPYRRAIGLDAPNQAAMREKVALILERMKGMDGDGTVEETCPISIISMGAWEWPQGVALFAMYQYYRQCGDQETLAYLKNWFDTQIAKGLPPQNINTTCPMLMLACIYEECGDEKYLPLLKTWAEGVLYELPRTPEGGLQHIVSGIRNDGQLWDDTLYMTVLFLARMGRVLKKEDYIQESVRQFLVHIKYLSDVKTGLFFHGWTFHGDHHFANALWGRGNSWYTSGLVDYLECLDGRPDMDGFREFLLSTLLRQVEALEKYQDDSGLWHTILDDSDSYLETSASCAFAYGILKAVRKGYLPARFALVGEKAVKGVLNCITDDGTVTGVSYGTPVFSTIQEYKDVPICPMPYGQSMALMMLVEGCRD